MRANAKKLNPKLDDDWFASHDLHVHVPAGAVPKDGPSSGMAQAIALISLLSNRPVPPSMAMTVSKSIFFKKKISNA